MLREPGRKIVALIAGGALALTLATGSTASAKAVAKHKKSSAKKGDVRHDMRHVADNMPHGWSWPPTRAMVASGKECLTKLDDLGVVWKPASATKKIVTPITVPSMVLGGVSIVPTFRDGPFIMDCHLALGLATFLPQLADIGVKELRFMRIYGYTRVRVGGVTKKVLSRHALGLAMDIAAMVDEDKRVAVVEKDYPKGDGLLLAAETILNASGGFRLVLTPKNDPLSHHDHFHLEINLNYDPPATTLPSS